MIDREEYNKVVREYFRFLIDKYNYQEVKEEFQISTLYDIEYTNNQFFISISYEIMGEGVNIVIFRKFGSKISNYDDYENTIHLKRIMMSPQKGKIIEGLNDCRALFNQLEKPKSAFEKELLKKALLLASVMMNTNILS